MNIIRLYNQNRKQLFIVILIVMSIIGAIHFVNYLVKKNNEETPNSGISSSTKSTTTYNPQQSAISSSKVPTSKYKIHNELINKFIEYCNEGKVDEAYNLLSTDCKSIMFPSLEDFKNNYKDVIFSNKKTYSIKNWIGDTYKINIKEDMLSTGKSNNGKSIEDYFTIVYEEEVEKLNINGFIERIEKNNKNSNKNLEIEIIYEDIYMDYTIYTIKAQNKTNNIMLLDSGESTNNMYIIDQNNIKHMSYRNEVNNAELKLLPYAKNTIQIKYSSPYISGRDFNVLVFNDIILNVNEYEGYTVKGNYLDRESIRVEI